MADVLIEQIVHLAAIFMWRILEAQQHPNFVQCHIQGPAMPNEGQPVNMLAFVHAVVAACTGCFWEQAFPLVVPDRLYLSVCGFGQFANLHSFTLSRVGMFYRCHCRCLTL